MASMTQDEQIIPSGGQVWTHKFEGTEVWILSAGVGGIRYKRIEAEKDEGSTNLSESEFKRAFRFERWRV